MLSISRLFADDRSFQYASNNTDDIEFTVNNDLGVLNEWSKKG